MSWRRASIGPVGESEARGIARLGGNRNVDFAARSAASTTPGDPPVDLGKDPAGDPCFNARRDVEVDGDTDAHPAGCD